MSRELMLIPKLRYEQLIKHEKEENNELAVEGVTKNVKSGDISPNDMEKSDELPVKSEDSPHNDMAKSEELPLENNRKIHNHSQTKHMENRKNQMGSGKAYISAKPEHFLKLNQKKEKLTAKRKWLSFTYKIPTSK